MYYPHCQPILPHRIPCYLVSQSVLHYCLFIAICSVPSRFSHDWLFVTQWTVAHQASLSMGFSRQEHWTGLPHCPPGGLPNLAIELTSLMSSALAGGFFTTSATWKQGRTIPIHYLTKYQGLENEDKALGYLKDRLN